VFIVGIQNVCQYQLDFRVSEATAGQIVEGSTKSLRIYTYDELVSQEQTAQIGRALLVGALQGVNAGLVGEAPLPTRMRSSQHLQRSPINRIWPSWSNWRSKITL
jgi:hypothetical protein